MPGRWIYAVCAVLLLTGVYACCWQAPLTWDGAYQFYYTLVDQRPYAYGTRLHSWLLWHPVVWLSHVTTNLRVLAFVFGLPFALAPGVSLLLCWWVVRRHAPWLIVWAVLGIAAAPLPGQIFIINDSILQQHLFWPVFVGIFVPLTRWQVLALVVLSLFQLSHPIGLVLLAIGAVAAIATALRPPHRGIAWVVLFIGLAALLLWKLIRYPDGQAEVELHFHVAQDRWRKGVAGAPLAGLACAWVAGLLLFVHRSLTENAAETAALRGARPSRPHFLSALALRSLVSDLDSKAPSGVTRWLGAAAVASALACGAIWLAWATDEHQWAYALDYRRWLVPLTGPFFLFCAIEGMTRAKETEPESTRPLNDLANPSGRGARAPWSAAVPAASDEPLHGGAGLARIRVSWVLAATFAAVLGMQSVIWGLLSRQLVEAVRADPRPVVPRSALPWIERTPLQHWATVTYLSILQGPTPAKLLLYDEADGTWMRNDPPRVPLAPWDPALPEPGPNGWFDYRPLVEAVRREQTSGGR